MLSDELFRNVTFRKIQRGFENYALYADFSLACGNLPFEQENFFSLLIGHELPHERIIILAPPLLWAVQERPPTHCPRCGIFVLSTQRLTETLVFAARCYFLPSTESESRSE